MEKSGEGSTESLILWSEMSAKQRLEQAEAILKSNATALRFSSDLEQVFKTESSDSRNIAFRRMAMLGMAFYNTFLFTDYFIISDQFDQDVVVHIIVTCKIVLVVMLVKRRIIDPDLAIMICLSFVCFTTSFFIFVSRSEFSFFLIFTIPLIIAFGSIMLPLRFKNALYFTSSCAFVSSIAVLLRPEPNLYLPAFAALINSSTMAYMLFGTFRAEIGERQAFLFNLRETLRADLLAEKLSHQQAVFHSVLDTGPDAMLLFDDNGTILSFSRAAEHIFGWNAIEVIYKNIYMFIHESSHLSYQNLQKKYIDYADSKFFTMSTELVGNRKDGSSFPMVLYVGEVLLGSERQFTAIIHDLSELRAAHDRSEDLRAQLAQVWSMNSLGEMAAALAHELNQPLAAITNYMQGARTTMSNENLQHDDLIEAVNQAEAQSLRAGDIISRIRGLIARKDADYRPESLRSMISEIDFMIRLVARQNEVVIVYELLPEPDMVLADRVQIQQVINNLVRNGCEAVIGCPRRVVRLSTRRDGDMFTISVDDTGMGIAPEMHEQLFIPLATSKSDGMGLGLSISQNIVGRHGGTLSVHTSDLGGASFLVNLPAYNFCEK